ncbi:MAG: PQQ-binding-like beta-propeller repeat protein [Verrucomicrobiae bacterium]|nr:PQQ-binding-like beta-propeller repeat protein [Verrucomicrobiae bacterium]
MSHTRKPPVIRIAGSVSAAAVWCGLGLLAAGCGPASKGAAGAGRPALVSAWPMFGGGPQLRGAVADAVPRDPVVAWTLEAGSRIDAGAAIAGDVVYVGCRAGTVFALALADGRELWRRSLGGAVGGTPAVGRDALFVGCEDGEVRALDRATGDQRWHFPTAKKVSAGPTVFSDPRTGEERVLINGYDGVARCLRARDARLLWSYATDEPLNGSAAVVDGRFAVFGGCDARVHVVELETGSGVAKIRTPAQIPSSVATLGLFGYFGSYAHQVMAVRIDGGAIAWTYEDRAFPFFGSPAVDGARVYIGSRDKHMHAIDRVTGKAAWKFRAGGRIDGAPVVFSDAVVFGSSDGRLYAVGHGRGEILWQMDLGSSLSSASPAYAKGTLVVGTEGGVLYALRSSEASRT